MRIYLLRHGETDWNIVRRLQGSVDTPLNANGRRQAESWRPYFDHLRLAGIYSSALERAIDTCFLATGHLACIEPGFNERGFGVWEGSTWAELQTTVTELDERWNDNDFYPPGGESRLHLFHRVQSALRETVFQHDDADQVLIVAHGASGHAILSSLLDQPLEARGSLPPLLNASLTILDVEDGRAQLTGQILEYKGHNLEG